MKSAYKIIILLTFVCIVVSLAIPTKDEHETDKNSHLKRTMEKELSDEPHEEDGEHNVEYDHEAFVGKEEAKEFDKLSPDESKHKLGLIYDKIDKDEDKQISEEELINWIRYVQNRYVSVDTERQWNEYKPADDLMTWDIFKQRNYGFLSDQDDDHPERGFSYKDMMRRDRRRWKKADSDNDDKLTKAEFGDFLHPEEKEHMRDVVIDETLEDIDKDKNGYISLEEYIGDMWPNSDEPDEPEWVQNERTQFQNFRDKNKDGQMDRDEVRDWIIPPDYDHAEAEAKHLIFESDVDRDGHLTKEEVINKYDIFVGSQATDFGDALTRHEEF